MYLLALAVFVVGLGHSKVSATCTTAGPGCYSINNVVFSSCAAGTYSLSGATACTSCPVGKYSGAEAGSCTLCADGKETNQGALTGGSSCVDCVAGKWSKPSTGTMICTSAAVGYIAAGAAATAQTICADGKETNQGALTGGSSCVDCVAGKWSKPSTGTMICTSAAVGYIAAGAAATAQSPCPDGKQTDTANAVGGATCSACADGKWSAPTTGTQMYCVDASNGYVGKADHTGQTICADGTDSGGSSGQLTPCLDCVAGKWSKPSTGTMTCTAALKGYFAYGSGTGGKNAVAQTPCVPGYEATSTGLGACTKCIANYYSPNSGTTACLACPTGSTTLATGSTKCVAAAGYYTVDKGATFVKCPAGTYSAGDAAVAGDSSCTACASGYASATAGAPKCDGTATGGSLNTAANSAQCKDGYSTLGLTGQTECTICPKGTWSKPSAGTMVCTPAVPGYIVATDGASQQTACVISSNTYSPASGLSACLTCPAGSSTALAGSTACYPCSVGYAGVNCVGCVTGSYAPKTGLTACYDCNAGSYSDSATAGTTCLPQPAGKYKATTDVVVSTTDCSAGKFCPEGSAAQQTCPTGTYSAAGAAACSLCAAGKSTVADGKIGTVSAGPLSGQAAAGCVNCAAGYFSKAGDGICTICPQGKYSPGALGYCTACPNGYSSPQGSDASGDCYICPAGTYTNPAAKNPEYGCLPCPSGSYSAATGLTVCSLISPANTYAPQGSTAPTPCPLGTHSKAGASACKPNKNPLDTESVSAKNKWGHHSKTTKSGLFYGRRNLRTEAVAVSV